MDPFPLTFKTPRVAMENSPGRCSCSRRRWAASSESWMQFALLEDSIRLATFTESPNRDHRGFLMPTKAATCKKGGRVVVPGSCSGRSPGTLTHDGAAVDAAANGDGAQGRVLG